MEGKLWVYKYYLQIKKNSNANKNLQHVDSMFLCVECLTFLYTVKTYDVSYPKVIVSCRLNHCLKDVISRRQVCKRTSREAKQLDVDLKSSKITSIREQSGRQFGMLLYCDVNVDADLRNGRR